MCGWSATATIGRVIIQTLAHELGVTEQQVRTTVDLLDQGNTVPFIARYRKEMTGGLDDPQLRTLSERLTYLRELEDRKQTILEAIDSQGKLTDELRELIQQCDTKARLEDLYLPYKKRRRTKADKAREAGLEPLLESLLADATLDPESAAQSYTTEGFEDAKAALEGARAIFVDRLATNADLVGHIRDRVWDSGALEAHVVEGKEQEGATYRDYFDFAEQLSDVPSHRVLALLRGEREGVISLSIYPGDDAPYVGLIADDADLGNSINHDGPAADWIEKAIQWGWRTKLSVSASLDARMRAKEKAEATAVEVFAKNLHDVLLAAPAGQKVTIGLDPGYRNGVKVAVVDDTGKVLDTTIVYPHQPQNRWSAAIDELATMCVRHHVALMAIGNGTASRETEKLSREVAARVKELGGDAPTPVVVSESGASVYSASELASKECPDLDVSLRGAVSIARRLQDPLAELVKVDPKSIGVGQYQHDVNQSSLTDALNAVVEDAVNAVGVDLNTASAPLLTRVAGVTPTIAENIVAYREDNGAFDSRKTLTKVPRLGPKAFEQCAGFLRIRGGSQPLDASAVHPESYGVVSTISDATGLDVDHLMGNSRVLSGLDPAQFAQGAVGIPTVTDIIAELDKPGRDPRPEFRTATFKEGIEKVSDLTPGMVLEGTVTNVAAFGAFVDIGVHQDGLVHVSAMSDRFVSDPHDVVKSGQVVRVKVMDVDTDRQRIGLSLRLNDEPGEKGQRRQGDHRENRRDNRDHASHRRGQGPGKPNQGGRKPHQGGRRGSGNRREQGGSMADALRRAGFGK